MTDWFAFGILCLAWGSTFIALKVGLEGFAPLALATWRFLLAGGILGLIALVRRRPGLPMQAFRPVLTATLALVVNYALLFLAAQHLPSGLAATFSFATVAFTMTVSSIILRLETPRITTWAGLLLGLIGLLLLAAPRLQSAQAFWPVLAVIFGNVMYVQSGLILRHTLRQHGTISVTTVQMLAGGLLLGVLSLALEPHPVSVTPRALAGLVYLSVIGSVIGFGLYQFLLVRWAPARLALYNFICPVIALALGAWLLHERLDGLEVLAASLMIVGAAISGLVRAA